MEIKLENILPEMLESNRTIAKEYFRKSNICGIMGQKLLRKLAIMNGAEQTRELQKFAGWRIPYIDAQLVKMAERVEELKAERARLVAIGEDTRPSEVEGV